jgi:hypothetical protein
MQVRVVPFVAKISNAGGASDAAAQLEALIAAESASEWQYVGLEQIPRLRRPAKILHMRLLFLRNKVVLLLADTYLLVGLAQ